MKFNRFLKQNAVPEWSEFYLDYGILKKLLSPAKLADKRKALYFLLNIVLLKANLDGGEAEASNLSSDEIELLIYFNTVFETVVMGELNKVPV
jgi:hypothetical protein